MNKLIMVAVIVGISGVANAKIDDNHQLWLNNPLSVFAKVSTVETKVEKTMHTATLAGHDAHPLWADTHKKN